MIRSRKPLRIPVKGLGVPVLDLVQLHCIPEQTLMAGKAFENLEKIKDVGLIKKLWSER